MDLKDFISVTEGFPKSGISFKDISPLLADGPAFKGAMAALADRARAYRPDLVIGPEARGFAIGAPLAYELGVGFVMARKKGKLPGLLEEASYGLEYGSDTLFVETGLIRPGARVLIADDLMATGGTARALVELVREAKAVPVGVLTLIELTSLRGAEAFRPIPYESLVRYPR